MENKEQSTDIFICIEVSNNDEYQIMNDDQFDFPKVTWVTHIS